MPDNRLVRMRVVGAGVGASSRVSSFSRQQRVIQDELNDAMNRLGQRATVRIRQSGAVPEDTGKLVDSIRAVFSTRASRVQVTIVAEAERDGFSYVAVTRFGHRKAVIRPRAQRFEQATSSREAPSLQIRSDMTGRSHWAMIAGKRFSSVKGVRGSHSTDWVNLVQAEVDHEVDVIQESLGRNVASRILRS